MPWYRFYAMHGPGHQSDTERYEFYEKPLTDEQRESYWHDFFNDFNNPKGGVEKVETIPARVHSDKVDECKRSIRYAEKLLKVLEKTKGETKYRGYTITPGHFDEHGNWCETRFSVRKKDKIVSVLWYGPFSFDYEREAMDAIDLLIRVRGDGRKFKEAMEARQREIEERRKLYAKQQTSQA